MYLKYSRKVGGGETGGGDEARVVMRIPESLYCAPETPRTVYANSTAIKFLKNIKKEKKRKCFISLNKKRSQANTAKRE